MVAGRHDGQCCSARMLLIFLQLAPSIRVITSIGNQSPPTRIGCRLAADASNADEVSCACSLRAKAVTPSRRAAFWLAGAGSRWRSRTACGSLTLTVRLGRNQSQFPAPENACRTRGVVQCHDRTGTCSCGAENRTPALCRLLRRLLGSCPYHTPYSASELLSKRLRQW